jgi:hypothetical protein
MYFDTNNNDADDMQMMDFVEGEQPDGKQQSSIERQLSVR